MILLKKCIIIYNPLSGKKVKYKFLPQFEKILLKYDYDTEIIYTEYKGHAKEIAMNIEHADLLLSIGGDGTFNEVVSGNFLRKDKLVCAHIPCGTTNDIGVMMGYGKNMIENLKMTLNGIVKKMDICLINNRPFIYVAAIGKFADIPYETPRDLKKKLGYFAYLSEGVKSFFSKTKLTEVSYEIDGVTYHGLFSFIIVSNANRISGINNVYKDIKLDDNKFEVLLCNISRRKDIIKSLYFFATSGVTKVPGIYVYKTDNLKIKFNEMPKKPWCVDGEKLEKDELDFNININRDIELMIPKKNVGKLFVNND